MRIERVTDTAVLEAIYRLRVTAWRARVPEFPALERWSDAFDADALHWAAFSEGVPVAAARLSVHDDLDVMCDAEVYAPHLPSDIEAPIGVISRLVVAPTHADRGLPALFDQQRIDFARRLGCHCILAHASPGTGRADELRAQGFNVLGTSTSRRTDPTAAVRAAHSDGYIVLARWMR